MDYSLAKELKDAGFPQNGKSCDTHSDINDSTLVERFVHPTLSELIEACPKQMGTATFVLGSAVNAGLKLRQRAGVKTLHGCWRIGFCG